MPNEKNTVVYQKDPHIYATKNWLGQRAQLHLPRDACDRGKVPVDGGMPQLLLNRGPNSAQIVLLIVGKSRLQIGAGWSFYADNTRPELLVISPRARSMVYSGMIVVTYCAMSLRHVCGMQDREVDSGLTSNCCAHAEQDPLQSESQGPHLRPRT